MSQVKRNKASAAGRFPLQILNGLESFVVASSKEMDGAALAINEQRFARNIVNVVSADEFGTIADGSIGEFMKFLPGITSDYTGGDARRFSISGVPAATCWPVAPSWVCRACAARWAADSLIPPNCWAPAM